MRELMIKLAAVAIFCVAGLVHGADLQAGLKLLLGGDYASLIKTAEQNVGKADEGQEWAILLVQGFLATGQLDAAQKALTNALEQESRNLRILWLGRQVLLSQGRTNDAAKIVERMLELASARPWAYRDAPSLVAFGRAALLQGGDPKRVLDKVFEAAKQADPKCRDVYLAGGELALDKHDYALAARVFEEGLTKSPDDPDLNYGLARAFAPSDRVHMLSAAEAALRRNANHTPSLILLADHAIDAEDYPAAEKLLEQVRTIHPWHPEAWAYEAVLAHLRHESRLETEARAKALKNWPANPRVDHLIGLKLSQKYRFREGAQYQRQALGFAPDYLPAKAQLAQDLLRLGDETTGWQLVREVHQADDYDVTAYNLVSLQDTMAKYRTLTNADFIVRMSAHEAGVFGHRVLELLSRAKRSLAEKYGLKIDQPVTVEIFPETKDFEIRTFGLPDNPGYLGVCFGRVITANSPAAHPGHPVNWEAMLWHEFCHVVTLEMTRHKMPRWLSEGISVHEERQADPAWGQQMNAAFREMILGDDFIPISRLSSAFLTAKSHQHLEFAYFESSLAVEFMVKNYGQDRLRELLIDLGNGVEINRAIEKRMAPLDKIDAAFAAYARHLAENLAPGLDWSKPKTSQLGLAENLIPQWLRDNPTNYWVLMQQGQQCVDDQQWEQAKVPLKKLIELCPNSAAVTGAYRLLAQAHRALRELKEEQRALARLAELDTEASEAFLRLQELAAANKDWQAVIINSKKLLAINPLIAPPYRYLAQACEAVNDRPSAASAYRTLLLLDPPNPAEVHFSLARVLHQMQDIEARKHVLLALEETPRNRAALRLLLAINRDFPQRPSVSTPIRAPTP